MKQILTLIAASALFAAGAHAADPTAMRIAGNFSSNSKHVDEIEKPFFTALPKLMGAPININYNPMDVVNVQAADALRLLRSGTFDVMSVQIGMASRDDPFFADLGGGNPLAFDQVDVADNRASFGRLFFKIPGGIQIGQHWLVVKFASSEVHVPFRILTKEEEKMFRKTWDDFKKEFDAAQDQ